jgi:hypothetical protein
MINSQHTLSTTSTKIFRSSSRGGTKVTNMFLTNTNATTSRLITIEQGTKDSKTTFITFNLPAQVSISIIDESNDLFVEHKNSIFAKASAGTDVILTVNYEDV